MSSHSFRTVVGFLLALCLGLPGCGQKDEDMVSAPAPIPSKKPPVARTRLQDALDRFHDIPHVHEPAGRPRIVSERLANRGSWLINLLNEGYAHTGHTNASWDEAVHQSFISYVDYTRESDGHRHYPALTNAVVRASANGCDDPMIIYMGLRYGLINSNYTKEAFALASLEAFRAMLASQYHPLLKFMAGLRASEAAYAAEPKGDRSAANEFVTGCLEDLARDTNAPATDVFECAFMWINYGSGNSWIVYVTSQLEEIIKETWGSDERYFEIRGLAEFSSGWNARGNDFADKVTTQGWKEFSAHLNQAALAWETAWQMNPTNAYIAYNMMRVELGQGQGRARMEKWFNRAMSLAPNYYDAAHLMAYYLEPRWYGSEEEAVKFARSCVLSTNWGGTVPLVLADLHRSLAAYYKRTGAPDHWASPGVWEDVHASYERFFQLNPSQYGYRHEYARDAYACGRYQEFLAQAKLFPWTNYTFFGGEQKFRQMLQRASTAK